MDILTKPLTIMNLMVMIIVAWFSMYVLHKKMKGNDNG